MLDLRRRRLCSRRWLFSVDVFLTLCRERICTKTSEDLEWLTAVNPQKVLGFQTSGTFQPMFRGA